jgi:hypothetical protein
LNKLDFLKLSIKNKCYYNKEWLTSILAITQSGEHDNAYPGKVIYTFTGTYFVDFDNGTNIKIDDAVVNTPLFTFNYPIKVDKSLCANVVDSPVDTLLGNLFFNLISIVPAFGNKLPFLTGKQSIKKVENMIVVKLQDNVPMDQRSDKYFYVDEYIKFCDSIPFLKSLAPLCVYSATAKNITYATNLSDYKQKLLAEYGDKLNDAVVVNEMEDKLQAYDDAFMKDDQSTKSILSGDKTRIARKQTFVMIGKEPGLRPNPNQKPVIESIGEGWPPNDPEKLANMLNASRMGSYSRGKLTQQGGDAAKVIMRATNAYNLIDEDCGTKMGLPRIMDKTILNQLIGREILINNEWLKIENDTPLDHYLDKLVTMRSPMYCKSRGFNICYHCAGDFLATNPDGIINALTGISNILLYIPMKKMHATKLSVANMDLDTALT